MSNKTTKKKKSRKKGNRQKFPQSKKVVSQPVSLSADQAFQLASQHFQAGNLQQSEQLCQQLLQLNPHNANANHLLGVITAQLGKDADKAIHYINQAIQVSPNNAQFHNNLGLVLDDIGRMEDAVASYKKAITINPGYAGAYNNHGVVLQKMSRIDEAIPSFRKAIAISPDYADAHSNLGIALAASDRIEDAIASFRKALSINADIPEAHNGLGLALLKLSKMDEAAVSFRKALSINPDYAEAYCNIGYVFQKLNRMDEAVASYRKAINIDPDYAEAYNNLGYVFHKLIKMDEAVASYRKALAINPDYAEAYHNLGFAYSHLMMHDEAIASQKKAIALKPDYAEAYDGLGFAHQISGRIEDAVICLRKALSLKPDFAMPHVNLGNLYQGSGKMEKALASYRKALSIDPENIMSFVGLSRIVKGPDCHDLIPTIEELYAKKDIVDEDKMYLGYVLGKFYEDLGKHEKAFGFYQVANQLQRKTVEYSIQKDQDLFDRITNTFSPAFFSSDHGSGNQDTTPIFILGMPRSGTTLCEQILASHPQVFGAGELKNLPNLIKEVCSRQKTGQYPECILNMDKEMFEEIGSNYIAELRKYSEDAKYITDKLPHNFQNIGLIKVALPNAKIIHTSRNPMDSGLSLFKAILMDKHNYAFDLIEIGQYYKLYLSLMEHWEKVLPGFMCNLRYEELVSDQESQTRKLLEFCGLPWNEACLDFHKTKREVKTLSVAQVRQPIYKDSVELWKRYEKQLEPLRKVISEE